ncbi:phosphate propanoyltransferase [Clostridium sp.]|uniref:phosphate propanoyltransferase n=1 Tax=Clostridium sp. TaxID=1506 RepID=UPI00290E63E8|nr:phosphate propanoyltransferase [Clostridium sp.]MDU3526325.1 phosphate propanoyltransferase [Clostridium sp.]
MDEKILELITKIVKDTLEKEKAVSKEYMVPIGVSARHIHLTQEHIEILFGPGYQLTKRKDLMGGQFAANEQVTIVGTKLRAIENIRVLGPARSKSQVEISQTDTFRLGIKAPIRESGNIMGSAPIAVVGPNGTIYLKEGCIIAKRHIHMSPKEAISAGVEDGEIVSVKINNDREIEFHNVLIRVDESYTLEMHIDADEANAANVSKDDYGYLLKNRVGAK